MAWWSWHDGTVPKPSPHGLTWLRDAVGVGWSFRSLAGTLADREAWLRVAERAAEPPDLPAEMFWPDSWLPIVGDQNSYLAADMSTSSRSGATIYYKERETLAAHAPPITTRACLPYLA